MFRCRESRHAGGDIFGRADFRPGACFGPDRLHREPVRQHDMMTRLVQLARGQLEAGRVDAPAVAEIEKTSGFVERKNIFDAVAQPFGDVTCVIRERL